MPSDLTPLMSFIERAARDPGFDLVKFEAMLRLQREVEHDQQRRAFNTDMALAQSEIGAIARTGKNPSFNNPYAKLEDLDRAARSIYTGHGFTVRYGSMLSSPNAPPIPPNHTRMVLIISHRDGYVEEHHLDGPLDTQTGSRARSPIQAVGSTGTYLRRYLLQMVLNLVPAGDPVDDDGEATKRDDGGSDRRPPDTRREEINRDVPLARPNGNGRPWPPAALPRSDAQWGAWMDGFQAACLALASDDDLDAMTKTPAVSDAIAAAPAHVRRDIDRQLATTSADLAAMKKAETTDVS